MDVARMTKPQLLAALENVQTVRPPRATRQSKAELVRCVRSALNAPPGSRVRAQMEGALADVRRAAEEVST